MCDHHPIAVTAVWQRATLPLIDMMRARRRYWRGRVTQRPGVRPIPAPGLSPQACEPPLLAAPRRSLLALLPRWLLPPLVLPRRGWGLLPLPRALSLLGALVRLPVPRGRVLPRRARAGLPCPALPMCPCLLRRPRRRARVGAGDEAEDLPGRVWDAGVWLWALVFL